MVNWFHQGRACVTVNDSNCPDESQTPERPLTGKITNAVSAKWIGLNGKQLNICEVRVAKDGDGGLRGHCQRLKFFVHRSLLSEQRSQP